MVIIKPAARETAGLSEHRPGRCGMATNITVAVRVRPLSSKEKARASHPCIVVQDGRQVNVIDPDDKVRSDRSAR